MEKDEQETITGTQLLRLTWPLILGTLICLMTLCYRGWSISGMWTSVAIQFVLYAWGICRVFKALRR